LPTSRSWPRDRPPLEVLGEFTTYTEVQPRIEQRSPPAGSPFSEHDVLHFDSYDGPMSPRGVGGLAVHRFVVRSDAAHDGSAPPGTFDANLAAAAALLQGDDPVGALRSNGGGYHSAATLRDMAEEPSCPCWGELHRILDAAAAGALAIDGEAGRVPVVERAGAVRVTESWINVNRGVGDFNQLHVHTPAAYSGVYYAQPLPDGAGKLNGAFVLPLTTVDEGRGADGQPRPSEVTYALSQARRGMLLLFPAYRATAHTPRRPPWRSAPRAL
jgi:hypothetical protein